LLGETADRQCFRRGELGECLDYQSPSANDDNARGG